MGYNSLGMGFGNVSGNLFANVYNLYTCIYMYILIWIILCYLVCVIQHHIILIQIHNCVSNIWCSSIVAYQCVQYCIYLHNCKIDKHRLWLKFFCSKIEMVPEFFSFDNPMNIFVFHLWTKLNICWMNYLYEWLAYGDQVI